MKAMLFAAGLGTRLRPITDTIPKALVKVGNTTLLEYCIRKLMHYGFDDICINVHHFPDMIINYLTENNNFGATITISDERDLLLDTGGGLKKAAPFFTGSEPFLVYNVDIVSNINLGEMLQYHNARKPLCTLAVREINSHRYFLFNDKDELCGWRNDKTGEEKISKHAETYTPRGFSGIQIMQPEALQYLPAKNIFSLVEFYLQIAKDKRLLAYNHEKDFWSDAGSIAELEKLQGFV
jgi:NDP-sugar pyrophosphorylase family protein